MAALKGGKDNVSGWGDENLRSRARQIGQLWTWVPPGGHVEAGEELLTAGLRELEEETGLGVNKDTVRESRILALWESVFPYCLHMGPPKRHHIVTYYLVRTNENRAVLQVGP